MVEQEDASVTREPLPIVLIRGFGGLDVEDERALTYQGFNVGTVYPMKRGENFIYEGMILRLMKSELTYSDATNVVGYYATPISDAATLAESLEKIPGACFSGDRVILDPDMAARLVDDQRDPLRTIWVLRYYDLGTRTLKLYGQALLRLIDLIRAVVECRTGQPTKVNVVAHSMGGLIVRQAVQVTYPGVKRSAADHINKIVTLGTPHQGIAFEIFKNLGWLPSSADDELEAFSPANQSDPTYPLSYKKFSEHFPSDRMLTVVGTNYRTYDVKIASTLNRLFSLAGEGGLAYNRSDGLVKISSAQLPGCPRTFVHKCHGGRDSLVTSREAYEIATRFFHGNIRVRVRLIKGEILRGKDWFGKSEFYLGVSIKPRFVDFDLFHQSPEAENCYGPFHSTTLDDAPSDPVFSWAGGDRLIWEGFLRIDEEKLAKEDAPALLKRNRDMVFRVDFYIGERDTHGIGFSDNVVFRKQYYIRAVQRPSLQLWLYTGEEFQDGGEGGRGRKAGTRMEPGGDKRGWLFDVHGTGFEGTFGLEADYVPTVGEPAPIPPS